MREKELADLTEAELLKKKKKIKSSNMLHAFLIGIFIGVAVYSAVKNGFGFATFFPLIFVYFLMRNGKKTKDLEEELNSRDTSK